MRAPRRRRVRSKDAAQRQRERLLVPDIRHQTGDTLSGRARRSIRHGPHRCNDRRVWKQQSAIAERELERRVGHGNHDIDVAVAILSLDVVAQRDECLLRRKPIGLQILRKVVDGLVSNDWSVARIAASSTGVLGKSSLLQWIASTVGTDSGCAADRRLATRSRRIATTTTHATRRESGSGSHFRMTIFTASWIWREDPASPVANRVLVILPNEGLPTMFPGGPKFGWLNRSKTSMRNCRSTLPAVVRSS